MNAMFERHLWAAYAVTWFIQGSYLGYVVWKWRTSKKGSSGDQQN